MKIKLPPKINKKFIENFFIKKGLRSLVDLSKKKEEIKRLKLLNLKPSLKPTPPELHDLYNLYQYVFF